MVYTRLDSQETYNMEQIQYDDKLHRYSFRGTRYLSATQVLDLVKPKFEAEEIAKQYAKKAGRTKEDWLDTWDDIRDASLDRGNAIHNMHEYIINNRSIDVVHGRPLRVRNPELFPHLSLKDYPDGVYTERIVWDHRFQIAGRCDKFAIETVKDKRYVHIDDYKTNRLIRFTSYHDKEKGYKMLLPPLDHLMACEAVVYNLQLSLYMHMFMCQGFHPGNMRIIHFPHIPKMAPPGARQPDPVVYDMKFLHDDILTLLRYYKTLKPKAA